MVPFIIAAAACLLGAVIMAFTTRPQHVSQRTPAGAALATETSPSG
jgi:hypothetical protein